MIAFYTIVLWSESGGYGLGQMYISSFSKYEGCRKTGFSVIEEVEGWSLGINEKWMGRFRRFSFSYFYFFLSSFNIIFWRVWSHSFF